MIEGLVPYPEYRDSGLPWLPKIPASWSVVRNGRLFTQRNTTGYCDLPILEVSLRSGVRVRDMKDGGRKQVMSDRSKYKQARAGDLAYNTMRMWQGAVGVAPVDGLVSPAYVIARPAPDVDAAYFARLYRTADYMREIDNFSHGIVKDRNRLYWESFKQIPTPCPPYAEQMAIIRVLADVDRRVRSAVHSKRRLISLLVEQKQVTTDRYITRGREGEVRLKPSGIAWLGEVPNHWTVRRLKEVTTRIEQGWSPQCDAQAASKDEWGVLKVGCVNGDALDETQNKRLPSSLEPRTPLEIQDGEILVSRANTRELLGLAALVVQPRRRLLLCDKLFRFRARPGLAEALFLVYAIRQRTSRAQIEASTNGASESMQNIGQSVIRNLLLACPPLNEQRRIVAQLADETASAVAAISSAEHEIALINEYHTRAITDVVTGRIDVREVAKYLPEHASAGDPSVATLTFAEGAAVNREDELVGVVEGRRT